ncbi:MAG TPA: tyrosine--tRNA ligase [Dehalococcoidia bacterium]|nr:tyrosine--tRNA ligase [Dehalococcoidia bacterium]
MTIGSQPSGLTADVDQRLALISRGAEEIMTRDELRKLLAGGQPLKHYIGFEISGRIHLGTGLACMAKVKDLVDAGVDCTVFLADWHTWINDKLGGDREVIRRIARDYFEEGLRASFSALGGDPSRLQFVLASDLYASHGRYWETVIEVSKNTTLSRMRRSITILGRKEGDTVDFAKLIYPAMQVADIFALGVHIAHAGMDQRKAHVIARDTALKLTIAPLCDAEGRRIKPIALHHHLLLGLSKPPVWPPPEAELQDFWASMKMSKSDPSSAVFVDDEPDDIVRKVRKAFCPPAEVQFNPMLDWAESLVFREAGSALTMPAGREGGSVTFDSYEDLAEAYAAGRVHPADLKTGIAEWLIAKLEPVRRHFNEPGPRAAREEVTTLLAAASGSR